MLLLRATCVWESIDAETDIKLHTNFVFVDEEDSHILAIIHNNRKHTYCRKIKEGIVYSISQFIVVPAPKDCMVVDRNFALSFYHRTNVVELEGTESIPRYKFELKNLEKAPSFILKRKTLIGEYNDLQHPYQYYSNIIGMVVLYTDAG
ncbi:hypothetical protein DCAR_0727771 [Daucus carota subsp. sativus]|uniref:Replication protein A 70 kDa DNA-binding subunit B/D first OB fold domain-containing protein n=1 Tax=Daucus carota subsp. sativus TaxID=79200 RepID=A0A161X4N2_DAUCS|nr:hypothetical protein DCAR_0727771 [Daucus carota subsp. sativus]